METTLGQQPPNAAADLDPPASSWLPLTAADVQLPGETAAPEHGWPGSLFVLLSKLTAIGCGIGAAAAAVGCVIALLGGATEEAGLAALVVVGLGIGCMVQGTLGRRVEHFSRIAWWGAMAELVAVTAAKLNVLVADPGNIGALLGLVLDVVWIHYFWRRRADFDIDIDL
jgi:hypothetical protein